MRLRSRYCRRLRENDLHGCPVSFGFSVVNRRNKMPAHYALQSGMVKSGKTARGLALRLANMAAAIDLHMQDHRTLLAVHLGGRRIGRLIVRVGIVDMWG